MTTGRRSTSNFLTALHLVLAAVITIALLFFAWMLRESDRSLSGVVVGAAIAFWLRTSEQVGREVARDKQSERAEKRNGYGPVEPNPDD